MTFSRAGAQAGPNRRATRSRLSRSTLTTLYLAVAALVLPAASMAATSGTLDTSFGSGGYASFDVGSWSGAAAVVVQPDGKIVTAGQAEVDGVDVILATRSNADGSADRSFGSRGTTTVPIGSSAGVDSGAALVLQPDGKILIAGAGEVGGKLVFATVRLTTRGSLDRSFGQRGIAAVPVKGVAFANAIQLLPDGKIVLAGTAREKGGSNHFAAARLDANGSLDESFGTNGVTVLAPVGGAWGMVVQPDGRLVLAGQQTHEGTEVFMAARLTQGGVLDPSFGQDGIVTVPVGSWAVGYAIVEKADGRLLVTGNAITTRNSVALLQLTPDGARDTSFGTDGVVEFAGGGVNAMLLDSAGRTVLAGVGASAARLLADGSLDSAFGWGGGVAYGLGSISTANGLAFQSDGKIVLAGAAEVDGRYEVLVMRLHA